MSGSKLRFFAAGIGLGGVCLKKLAAYGRILRHSSDFCAVTPDGTQELGIGLLE